MVAVLLPGSTPFAVDVGAELLHDDDRQGQAERPTGALADELSRALGMTPAEVEALGLSPAEMQNLLAGFAEETVVVGSRAKPRSATESAVPVDVLSAADLVSRGAGNLSDLLRTIVPSFSVNSQPISGNSTRRVRRPSRDREAGRCRNPRSGAAARRHLYCSRFCWLSGALVAEPCTFSLARAAQRSSAALRAEAPLGSQKWGRFGGR